MNASIMTDRFIPLPNDPSGIHLTSDFIPLFKDPSAIYPIGDFTYPNMDDLKVLGAIG